jgi:hypothetical protein
VTTPFGPQLIGETEKTLNAILRRLLHAAALTEPQWVTLRLAGHLGATDDASLAAAVADRAHFADTATLVDELTARGLLAGGELTAGGRELVESVQAVIATTTAPIWRDLAADDVTATERLLNELVRRGREVLGAPASSGG